MKITKINMMAALIAFCVFLRICIDTFFSEEKPFAIVLIYTGLIYIVSIFLLFKGKKEDVRNRIVILLLLFISLFIPLLYSDVPTKSFVINALQIYTPCFFLVAAVSQPLVLHQTAVLFRQYMAFPTIVLILLAIYRFYHSNTIGGEDLFSFYTNNPNHVLAQTLLKFSLVMINARIIWILGPILLMLLINVRSVILSYIFVLFYFYRGLVFSRVILWFFPLVGIVIFFMLESGVNGSDLVSRLIFKGLESSSSSELSTATSGRTEIYQFYISFITNSFSLSDWLFGIGPIWLSGFGPKLSAHNDILNSIVTFGVIGLAFLLWAYYQFFKVLPALGKSLFVISFSILFLTNGVLFHQSNILFVLLFFYFKSGRHDKYLQE